MHKSVLIKEVIEWLQPAPGKIIVDGTLGAGGHARAILEKMGPSGRLIGLDRDPEALRAAKDGLASFGDQLVIAHDNFKNIAKRLEEMQVKKVQGVLLHLGVSSMQLDEAGRGFSFRQDAPLDMRMDPSGGISVKEVVNKYSQEELQKVLWELGEERFGRKIAASILRARSKHVIGTTLELANIISESVPPFYRFGRIHPATRSFQALRMLVNDELGSLRDFLLDVTGVLDEGGRVAVISFHSLEDRMVKTEFKRFQAEGEGRMLTKKPVRPFDDEMADNPRSRSAKMRVFERSGRGS